MGGGGVNLKVEKRGLSEKGRTTVIMGGLDSLYDTMSKHTSV